MITLIYTDASNALQTIDFDATLRELHSATAQPTEHPVEVGVDLTDHVRPDRARISCDVFVTNTPIGQIAKDLGGVNSQLQLTKTERVMTKSAQVSGGAFSVRPPGAPTLFFPVQVTPAERSDRTSVVAGNVLQFPVQFDRVRDVYEKLETLRRAGTPVAVLSSLRDYDSMVISSLSAPRDHNDSVTFQLELTEVRFAESQTIDAPVPLERRGAKVKPQGPKATYELDPQQESRAHVGFETVMSLYSRDGQN